MTEDNTQHPDILEQAGISIPQEFDPNATDGDGDGFVQDGSDWHRPAPEVVAVEPVALAVEPETLPVVMAEPEPEQNRADEHAYMKEEEPIAAAPEKKRGKKSEVGSQIADGTSVYLSKVVFESDYAKNSNSVAVLQARLIELGYVTAGDDKRGWISAGTAQALAEFKSDNAVEADLYSEELIKSVFAGTSVQVLP